MPIRLSAAEKMLKKEEKESRREKRQQKLTCITAERCQSRLADEIEYRGEDAREREGPLT